MRDYVDFNMNRPINDETLIEICNAKGMNKDAKGMNKDMPLFWML